MEPQRKRIRRVLTRPPSARGLVAGARRGGRAGSRSTSPKLKGCCARVCPDGLPERLLECAARRCAQREALDHTERGCPSRRRDRATQPAAASPRTDTPASLSEAQGRRATTAARVLGARRRPAARGSVGDAARARGRLSFKTNAPPRVVAAPTRRGGDDAADERRSSRRVRRAPRPRPNHREAALEDETPLADDEAPAKERYRVGGARRPTSATRRYTSDRAEISSPVDFLRGRASRGLWSFRRCKNEQQQLGRPRSGRRRI